MRLTNLKHANFIILSNNIIQILFELLKIVKCKGE